LELSRRIGRRIRAPCAQSKHRDGGEVAHVQRLDVPFERIAVVRPWRVDQTLRAGKHVLHAAQWRSALCASVTVDTEIKVRHNIRLATRPIRHQ
jgi:hypothetical protein